MACHLNLDQTCLAYLIQKFHNGSDLVASAIGQLFNAAFKIAVGTKDPPISGIGRHITNTYQTGFRKHGPVIVKVVVLDLWNHPDLIITFF